MKSTFDEIFQKATEMGASDVHLVVGQPPLVRIDGKLAYLSNMDELKEVDTQAAVTELLVKPQRERFYQDKELDTAHQLPSGTRLRINFHWALGKVAVAARIINQVIPSMEDIGMPQVAFDMLSDSAGLVLITGPTGSGKSTTMASMVEKINQEHSRHIITLEDPIEYLFESKKSIVKQREYGTDFLSFPEALKRVLRQDPNVIMVGEMRDLESIALAITLAETGHLVFATLHTYSGSQTIDRIVDSFPPYQQSQIRLQLSLTLKAVLSQRLVPRIGGGRVAVREVLINTNAVSNLVRENKIAQIQTVIETGGKYGMVPMNRALKELVDQGLVDKEEAKAYDFSPRTYGK
jgi:twitching motility protein PilT